MRRQHNAGLSGLVAWSMLVMVICAPPARAALVVDFEDLLVDRGMGRANRLRRGGVTVLVPAGVVGRGSREVEVAANGKAGGGGSELQLHGLIQFEFPEPLISLSFQFYASQILVRTGDSQIEIDLDEPDTSVTVDDLQVSTSGVSVTGLRRSVGMFSIEPTNGTFDSVFIGTNQGRNFLIMDNLTLTVPEPASLLPLGMMGGVMLARRKR